MTRMWLLLTGAVAIMTFALIVLVVVPDLLLRPVVEESIMQPYTVAERRGRRVYISEGCVYCHSQQIRDPLFTVDQRRGWGRPTVPADYVFDSPHLLGTMRTGPDLINVGARLPDPEWHLIHLWQPRAIVEWSIMPSFPYLFEVKDAAAPGDVVLDLPEGFAVPGKVVVPTQEALDLVAYLLSLDRSYPLPTPPPEGEVPPEGAAPEEEAEAAK